MNQNDQYLEVIITKDSGLYKASTPTFPTCKGLGEDEQEALKKLAMSIGRLIGRLSREHMHSVFSQSNYTEVIVDPDKKDVFQHRVYDINPKSDINKKNVLVKFKPYDSIQEGTQKEQLVSDIENMLNSNEPQMDGPYVNPSEDSPIRLVSPESAASVSEQEDGFVFGIPICLN